MKLLILSIALTAILAFAFLKSETGRFVEKGIVQEVYNPLKEVPNQLQEIQKENKTTVGKPSEEKTAKDLCINVTCPKSTLKCPDNFLASCANSCANGECPTCVPNCSSHQLIDSQQAAPENQNAQQLPHPASCTESWLCSGWSACSNNVQTRDCSDSSNCGTQNNRSAISQSCTTEQPSENPAVKITNISYLAPEWVEILNIGNVDVNLANWTLKDNTTIHIFTFPAFMFQVGAKLKIHTENGTNSGSDLYWGYKSSIWNNNGDEATLKDKNGNVVDVYGY